MEAPDKIYLERIYSDNGVLPNGLHYSPSLLDIEYIRKEKVLSIIRGAFGPQDALNKINSL